MDISLARARTTTDGRTDRWMARTNKRADERKRLAREARGFVRSRVHAFVADSTIHLCVRVRSRAPRRVFKNVESRRRHGNRTTIFFVFCTFGKRLAYPHLAPPPPPPSNPSVVASNARSSASITSNAVGARPSANALAKVFPRATLAKSTPSPSARGAHTTTSNAPALARASPPGEIASNASATFPSTAIAGNASSTTSAR